MRLEAYRPHHEILLGHDEDFDTFSSGFPVVGGQWLLGA